MAKILALLLVCFAAFGQTLSVINTGTTSNDGTGDSLRSAFTKANTNFYQLWSEVFTNIPVDISTTSNALQTAIGNISTDGFIAKTNGTAVNLTGSITNATYDGAYLRDVKVAFVQNLQTLLSDASPSVAKLAFVLEDDSSGDATRGTYRYDPTLTGAETATVFQCQDQGGNPSTPGRWVRMSAGDNYQMSVDTLDDALAVPPAYLAAGINPTNSIKLTVKTRARKSLGKKGGTSYYYSATAPASTNLGTVVPYGSGYLLWDGSGEITPEMFGAIPDDEIVDTDAIRSAISYVEATGYKLTWPAGTFLIDGTLTNNKSEWAGMRTTHLRVGSGYNTVIKTTNWNAATYPRAILFEPTGSEAGAPWIHDLQIEGQRTNTLTKNPITAVASRTQFSVSTNAAVGIPSASQTNVWPYYGFVFFYTPQGHFIGRSVATDITASGTNYVVTLAPDTLWYSTEVSKGGLLDTNLFAVFSQTISTSGTLRSDPTSAGVRGIELTGGFGGKLENVGVKGFHTAIAFTPASVTSSHILNDVFAADYSFAGFAASTRGFNGAYDYVGNGYLFATGFKSPTGTDLSLTNGGFVSGGFGFYNLPEFSKYDYLWSDGNVIAEFMDGAGSIQADYLLADNTILHGIMVENGLTVGGFGKAIYHSAARLRALGSTLPQYHVDDPGSAVWVRGVTTPASLSFGNVEINPGGNNDFAYGFNITNGAAHSVFIGHIADSVGYTNATAPGSLPPIITRTDLSPAALRYTGMHYANTNLLYTLVNGSERARITGSTARWMGGAANTLTLAIDADGLFVGNSTNYTAALGNNAATRAYFHNTSGNTLVISAGVAGTGIYAGRSSSGTAASPTALGINSTFAAFDGQAYNGTTYATTARIAHRTEEAQTGSAQGSRIDFEVTPTASTTRAVTVQVRGEGQLQLYSRTSSPSTTIADGQLWYRSDTDVVQLRANGATVDIATKPATETLTASGGTLTITAGKGPNQSSRWVADGNVTLAFASLSDNDSGRLRVWPATTNVTITLPNYASGPSGSTLTVNGGTGWTNYTEIVWVNGVESSTNRVSINALNYYR